MNAPSEKKALGRPTVFQDSIYVTLRTRIVSGQMKPNDRFPTRRALCKEFDASTVTIQQVVDRLVADNFLEAHGARGTFVTAEPPHLTQYALVFPHDMEHNRFWFALASEASRLSHTENVKLVNHFNIDGHTEWKEYQNLVDDVTHHRIAGLIFASPPFLVEDTPLVQEPGIPRVLIGRGATLTSDTQVIGNSRDIIIRAADIIKREGKKNVALLLSAYDQGTVETYVEELGIRGVHVPPWWVQHVPYDKPVGARNLANLLTRSVDGKRPDALIIGNDNLVEHATLGLKDSGISIPDDLLVVSHCNFPWPPRNHTPVIRIGHNTKEYLEICMQAIDKQRRGEECAPISYVSEMHEEVAEASPNNPNTHIDIQ